MIPGVSGNVGRPGMEMWRIPVTGVVKRGPGPRLRPAARAGEPAPDAAPVPRPRGRVGRAPVPLPDAGGQRGPPEPEASGEGQPAGRRERPSGRGEKARAAPLRGRCDSFVAGTDVHYPTDVSLLWDAMRCPVREHPCFGSSPDPGFLNGFRATGSVFSTPLSTGGCRAGMPGRSARSPRRSPLLSPPPSGASGPPCRLGRTSCPEACSRSPPTSRPSVQSCPRS